MPAVSPRTSFRGRLAAALAAILVAAGAPYALAQEPGGKYQEIERTDPPEFKAKKPAMFQAGKAADAAEEDLFVKHFTFRIAELTKAANRDKLADKRLLLKKDLYYLGRAPATDLHEKLVGLLANTLPKLFGSRNYHPAVRTNCLLLYGDLYAKEPEISGAGGVPLPAALATLRAILADNKQPANLRAVSLVGIARHSESSTTPEARKDLVQTLLTVVTQPAGEGESKDVHNYLRRRAAELLRLLATKGPEANLPQVADGLQKFAADPEARLEERCEAARALGALASKSFPEASVGVVAKTLAGLLMEIARQSGPQPAAVDESGAAPTSEGAEPAAGARPLASVVKPAVKASDKAAAVLSPDVQAYLVDCVQVALNGLDGVRGRGLAAAGGDDDAKALVSEVSSKVDEMVKIVGRKKKGDRLSSTEVQRMHRVGEELLPLLQPPPAVRPEGAEAPAEGEPVAARP